MILPERDHHGAIGFLEATRQLAEDDGLVLSRNRVQLIHDEKAVYVTPVHYEGLNFLSEVYQPITPGTLVTSEFQNAASEAMSETGDKPWITYPLMTVINHSTDVRFTETVNVAKLINEDTLPVYSLPARSTQGGELLTLGVSTLIKRMAWQVGVNPVGAVVIEDGGAHTVEETGLRIWTHLPSLDKEGEVTPGEPTFDPRGLGALSLLQMDIAQMFMSNRHRVTENTNGRVEVVVRVGTQPDLQTVLLSLIDLVESNYLRLYYTNDEIATGEIGSVFKVVDDSFTTMFSLSGERSIDMAAYNAYLAAVEIFNER